MAVLSRSRYEPFYYLLLKLARNNKLLFLWWDLAIHIFRFHQRETKKVNAIIKFAAFNIEKLISFTVSLL